MRNDAFWTELTKLDKDNRSTDGIPLMDLIQSEFQYKNLDDYEKRGDGEIVRKDRWERGISSIRSLLADYGLFSYGDFEIDDVVNAVKQNVVLWKLANFDDLYESEIEEMNLKTYLVTIKQVDNVSTMEAVFSQRNFYAEILSDGQVGRDLSEIGKITHYAEMPSPYITKKDS